MKLSQRERSTITNALRVAKDVYVDDARICDESKQPRLGDHFRAQIADCLALIERIEQGDVPNLDALTVDELDKFYACYRRGNNWQDLIDDEDLSSIDAQAAVVHLAEYAFHKALAMRARERGAIGSAWENERECESIYKRLPESARW